MSLAADDRKRRDARIRFLQIRAEVLRRRLDRNRVILSPEDRAHLLRIGCELGHDVKDILGILTHHARRRWIREPPSGEKDRLADRRRAVTSGDGSSSGLLGRTSRGATAESSMTIVCSPRPIVSMDRALSPAEGLSPESSASPADPPRSWPNSVTRPMPPDSSAKDRGHIKVEFLSQITFRLDDSLYVDPVLPKKLQALLESDMNILLDGPQGSGKTVLSREIARALDLEYVFFNCSSVYEATDFLATLQVKATKRHGVTHQARRRRANARKITSQGGRASSTRA